MRYGPFLHLGLGPKARHRPTNQFMPPRFLRAGDAPPFAKTLKCASIKPAHLLEERCVPKQVCNIPASRLTLALTLPQKLPILRLFFVDFHQYYWHAYAFGKPLKAIGYPFPPFLRAVFEDFGA